MAANEARSERDVAADPDPAGRAAARRPWLERAAVAAILGAHFLFSWSATLWMSATFDEVLHVAAGLSYWQRNDYRLQPENGNLPQRWASLPLVCLGTRFPPTSDPDWLRGDALPVGQRYLYASGNAPETILAVTRFVAAAWSTALCWVIFRWSRSLFGLGGGLVSLALAAAWPAFVAHGPLVTSDVCGALWFTVAVGAIWRVLHRVSPLGLAGAAVAVGLAFVSKHVAVLLLPVAAVLLGLTIWLGPPVEVRLPGMRRDVGSRFGRLALAAVATAVVAAVAVTMIWATVGFRYSAAAPGLPLESLGRFQSLERACRQIGGLGEVVRLLGEWRLLPEAWLYGFCHVVAASRMRNAFALGLYSVTGWWWYFPLCLLIKNTLPGLTLCGAGLVAWLRTLPSRAGYRCIPLVAVLVVLWPFFLLSSLNLGERHLLPSYPPLIILAGGIWPLVAARPRWRRVVVAAVVLHGADVVARYPVTFPYFNQLVPSARAHWWLVDSNLDWGQDLPRLSAWLARHNQSGQPVYVAYFGSAAVDHSIPEAMVLGRGPAAGRQQLTAGLYCVSATAYQSVFMVEPPGRWNKSYEETYAGLRHMFDEAGSAAPPEPAAVASFNGLQTGRLLAWLRRRGPLAIVGRSILVFKLSAADVAAALSGPPAELDEHSLAETDPVLHAESLLSRANRLLDSGLIAEAIPLLEAAVARLPTHARAWGYLGVARQATGHPEAAGQAFAESLRCDPRDPETHYNQGLWFASLGQWSEAEAAMSQALALRTDFREAVYNRGMIRRRLGRDADSRADLARFQALGGTLPADPGKASP
jgi:4-amino-4-deoxy-L-arabinose transferase-like glycosyltransferase